MSEIHPFDGLSLPVSESRTVQPMQAYRMSNHPNAHNLKSGIYLIHNNVLGKCCIGASEDIHNRLGSHINGLRYGKHGNRKLLTDYLVHGLEAFFFAVLELCEPCQLADRERHWYNRMSSVLKADMTYHGRYCKPYANMEFIGKCRMLDKRRPLAIEEVEARISILEREIERAPGFYDSLLPGIINERDRLQS